MPLLGNHHEELTWIVDSSNDKAGQIRLHAPPPIPSDKNKSEASPAELAGLLLAFDKRVKLLKTEQEFRRLAQIWEKETKFLSNVNHKSMHLAYQRIISLGNDVVPFILERLKNDMNDWFWALTVITGENPITEEDAGDIKKMTAAWVAWGTKRGIVK